MKRKTKSAPKFTDAERHNRFVDMGREIGADETPESFDRAFAKVVLSSPQGAAGITKGSRNLRRPKKA
jgi:hypothetical protein